MKKFRVWNKNKKGWDGPECFLSQDGTLYEFDTIHAYNGAGTYIKANNRVIQFSTGLEDKNGKEIYKGDICKVDAKINKIISELCVVKFYASKWCIDMSPCYPSARGGWICEINGILKHEIKIIGNIFDNPELLKDQT